MPENYFTKGKTFGEAIEILKKGGMVARAGWNGKGMYIFQRKGFVMKKGESTFNDRYGEAARTRLLKEESVTFTPVLCMRAADGTVITGWLASQTDMLAEDWIELTNE